MWTPDDIAIIGFSFKLPQDVKDDTSFWTVLEEQRNLRTGWPESRVNPDSFVNHKLIKFPTRGAHFLNEDIGAFDAPFFSVTAQEAASMDPLQRWTLEESYRAFENSGIPVETLKGSRTAVFSASMIEDYARMSAMDPENVERTAATGSSVACVIPNRVSWYFDLRGPSIHVNTACSGSMSAIDMACKSIQSGDATAALVTGANMLLDPSDFQILSSQNFLSSDSLSYSFDHRANGYARGEGTLALVLKPVSAAIENGDMIRAVIRSTGSNQDGHTPVLTQPSPQSQEELIRHVYKRANLPLHETRYVEAHGTGTPVGDPIEMRAIGRVFRKCRSAEEPLYVGSVKANIGHLEGASGLASLIKSILTLEKGIIPPNALLEKVNPAIDVDFYHTEVPSRSIPWPTAGLRRVSVNSFGFGGSNTHVILDDALHYMQERGLSGNHCTASVKGATTDAMVTLSNGYVHVNGNGHVDETAHTDGSAHANGDVSANDTVHVNGNGFVNGNSKATEAASTLPCLLVWTAADENAVKRTIEGYKTFYTESVASDPTKLDRLAFTLAARRSKMLWRAFAVVAKEEEEKALSPAKPIRSSTETGLAFVFTGQGAQYVNMGWDLVQYPVFAETLRQINDIYASLGCKWSIFDELRCKENIDQPEYSQPLSTAIQIALVNLLESFGITPKAVVGHSSGEIAAAYTIGALSLPSACKVAYFRGQLTGKLRASSSTSPGAMLSINVAEGKVPEYLSSVQNAVAGDVTVACINSPLNCTLSGPEQAINAIKAQADQDGIFAAKLKTGVAYHSPSMRAIADEYLSLVGSLEGVDRQNRKVAVLIPMVSSVSGKSIRPETLATAQYWVDNLVSPVRFADAVQLLTQESSTLKVGLGSITDLVEIGPHPALKRPVNDTIQQEDNRKKHIRYESVLHRSHSAFQTTLELAGRLFCLGHPVSVPEINQQSTKTRPSFLVDCPKYPFDRTNRYWSESRIVRDFRLRGTVQGETLGVRTSDWNPLEPRWRNFLSIESTPWTEDHKISDTVLYPAAGMLIMALEAAQQMVPTDRKVRGYLVKQIDFMNPIIVPKAWEERTETQVRLRPVKGSDNDKAPQFDIAIFSYSRGKWTECCDASIQVEYQDSVLLHSGLTDEVIQSRFKQASESCGRPLDSRGLYRDSADIGLQYGPTFKRLEDVCWDGEKNALGRVDVNKTIFETSSVVHPAVLDQAFMVLRASAGQQPAANIPVRLEDAWLAASGWQYPQNSSIQWLATSNVAARRDRGVGEQGSLYALAEDGTVLCHVQQAVMATVSKKDAEEKEKKLIYSIEWKPQLSLLDPDNLSRLFPVDTNVDEAAMVTNYTKLCSALDFVALRTLRDLDRAKIPASLSQHVEWLDFHVRKLPLSKQSEADTISDLQIEAQLSEFENALPTWKLFTECARRLPEILAGEIDPLEVVFNSKLADNFYGSLFEDMCADGRLAGILDLAAHENPAMQILEVGAGTGGMTAQVLAALEQRERRTGAPSFAEYCYTDISPVFLDRARTRWPQLHTEGRLTFHTLDMDRAIETQGFKPASYDLVIAASVLHATTDLEAAIRNVRQAVKPGGRLVLLEAINPDDVAVNFMTGLVPGWWNAREDWRPHSPAVPESLWDICLRNNGFSGNDLVIRDYQSKECHAMSIIVTTAVNEAPKTPETRLSSGKLVLVVDQDQSDQQLQLANLVRSHLDPQRVLPTSVCPFSAVQLQQTLADPAKNDIVICLAEIHKPLLATLSEEDFATQQYLTKQASKLLWVTAWGPDDAQTPQYNAIQGFLRSIRAEQSDSQIVSLAIEGETDAAAHAHYIAKIVETSFVSSSSEELEYIVRNGVLMTGRAVENVTGNKTIQQLLSPQLEHKPWAKTGALQVSVGAQGSLDSLKFVHDTDHETPIGLHEVEIEAQAWGLSERDIQIALDRTGVQDEQLGGDCAGVVTRVGRDCDPSIQPGDRVCMSSVGCMRKYPRAHETGVVRIPHNLSVEAATSILHPALTAYHALVDISQLEEGDNVLVHLAASAVGQVAIRIAQMRGAHVYATSASAEEKEFLLTILGVPADNIFSSKSPLFATDVVRATHGDGVDVVLNSLVGEDMLRASCECLARGGRFIQVSRADTAANLALPLRLLARNITFSVVDPAQLRPKVLAKLLKSVIQLLGKDEIQHPQPLQIYNVSHIGQAFKQLQDKEIVGRIVITAGPEDVVPQYIQERLSWTFDENATYLIAGGSGGLGRVIIQWMADRGARNLIIPSRSGPKSKAAAEIIAQLKESGVTVKAPQCDVSDEASLSRMLNECAQTMPPIKGCINAAMVLQDAIFQNMPFAKWELTMRSKVQTSLNLHRLLPSDLDFFILLSSLAGVVGQMASCNYSAGCAFQDALARYRVTQGQKALSFDIGWMRDVGIIAETESYQNRRQVAGDLMPVDGTELLALLDMCCDPTAPAPLPADSQVLFGLLTPADCLAQGRPIAAVLDRPLLAAFSYLPNSRASSSQGGNGQGANGTSRDQPAASPATLFRQSADSGERIQIVLQALAVKLALAMSISPEDVEPSKPLSTYGVDSLMAVDLRNWIGKEFGATVAVFEIMGGVPLASIADLVVSKSTVNEG
ncbi:polyketide synthase [Penicillium lagena]|uniref:polyketide synthase n=1 Tax=Penicillium lagena TaxID=94218 RepID=UPI00253F71C9|nr:polyketide synthase [Penicillium lagena]KAJ5605646.1 polyketide synthase [Penicillium lagena]